MSITFALGWWLAPLAVTIGACGAAWWIDTYDSRRGYDARSYGDAVVSILLWSPAIIVSLVSWLIWAVLT